MPSNISLWQLICPILRICSTVQNPTSSTSVQRVGSTTTSRTSTTSIRTSTARTSSTSVRATTSTRTTSSSTRRTTSSSTRPTTTSTRSSTSTRTSTSTRSSTTSTRTSTSSTRTSTSSTRTSTSTTASSTSSSTRSSTSTSVSSSSSSVSSSSSISSSSTTGTSTSSSSSSLSSSMSSTSTSLVPSATPSANSTLLNSTNIASTILVIARDETSVKVAAMGLNGYGIPYEGLIVPAGGTTLPTLNTSSGGNYGGIIVSSAVSYSTSAGYVSALTTDQWNQLYAYQTAYGVRMVQWDIWPDASSGVVAVGSGCCGTGVEQLVSLSNTTSFAQAGLKTGATLSTEGLYHYPASITDTTTTWEIAQFASNSQYTTTTTAAVVNNFNGREQMVFFMPFSMDWSPTSNVLQHAWITYLTRGLYAGYRRVYLNTQIDDMFLQTDIYYPANAGTYRVTSTDMATVATWVDTVNGKLNTGSSYFPEIGYNGNGVVENATTQTGGATKCSPGAIEYDNCYCDTSPLEFQKTPGAGISVWPTTPTTYAYNDSCLALDPLEVWFANTANRDKFAHISHTYTHLELNNATYSDALKEIQFNQAFLSHSGLANGRFSAKGLIPPAITGLHNADVLKAWTDAGLTNCVGDNTRPVLRSPTNDMWPLITNTSSNGFDGFQVNPRWATRIYYNCDTTSCTTQEWIVTSNATGTWDDLIATEKSDTTRHLFGLYHDPYMFHQANLRTDGLSAITVNGVSQKLSLFQAWVETVVVEFIRLVNWPILTLKHDDFSTSFAQRMTRDQCGYKLTYAISNKKITGVTLTATNNQCGAPIPVTFPGPVANSQGFTTEQVGSDPLTIWVTLSGNPVSFTLSSPVSLL